MVIVTVLYPKTETSRFDFDYYLGRHVPLVKERFEPFGLTDVRLIRGTTALDGSNPGFELMGQMTFPSPQHLQDALRAHGDEILGDIAVFTDVQPAIQMNEPL